jgi:drug/metabolite transporter superfamily protein YnfA
MNRDARLMSGILLVTVPTIQCGGYFLLRLFSGQMLGLKPSPPQTSFFRAGHAHAGVLVILSLICQTFVEHATSGTRIRVAGANRCSASRHSDSAGVLSFGGVHEGSPE